MIDKIRTILEAVDRKEALEILSKLISDYDLPTASNLIKKDCEPWIDKECLSEHRYSEGNEDAGYIDLSLVLEFAEEILNCDDREYGDIKFEYFVRPETQEEAKENEHNDSVTWFVKDEKVEINKLQIQFGM